MRPLLLLLALAVAGCGAAPVHDPGSASLSPYSSVSAPSAPSDFSPPSRGGVRADLVLRPDALEMGFALRETDADPQRALAAAQAAVEELRRRMDQATGSGAGVRMCGAQVSPIQRGKAADDEAAEYAVTVDGTVEVPLAASLDYWARARLVMAIRQHTDALHAAAAAAPDGRRGASFEAPRPVIKDPEAHRGALTDRWLKRARAFADAAQAGAAPLHLLDCAPPGEIQQQVISLEEIGLSLAIECKLDTPEKD